MKKSLINEITKMRKVMGLNESPMPEFMRSSNLFGEGSPAPARPDTTPEIDAPPRTSPGKPDRQHPFKPNPIVKPNPKAMMETSPAPARPDTTPEIDAPPRTSPGKPERQHPFKPNPIVKPNPKAMMEDEATCPCGEKLDEGQNYTNYHDSFSSAVQDARRMAEEAGYVIDEDDWSRDITFGSGKPKNGQTFRASIGLTKDGKPQEKALTIVVYDRGTKTNNYELTTYIF